jgi:predicted PhzF superfamily epimerase YddE/YHI9
MQCLMASPIFVVDAFSAHPFGGNPAGVCLLPSPAGEAWMQAVAAEMNCSETAFLYRENDVFSLRWFTPRCEVDLCGHATLAACHVLWERGDVKRHERILLSTRSGPLEACWQDGMIMLDFPAEPPVGTEAPPLLLEALDLVPVWTGKNRFDYLLEVATPDEVRTLSPDFVLLAGVPMRGVMVTAACYGGGYDFVSRFFAPSVGVPEDPVTGSAHCCLGPYWQTRLGRGSFVAWQASSRGGEIWVSVAGDRVHLGGRATTVAEGYLRLIADSPDPPL